MSKCAKGIYKEREFCPIFKKEMKRYSFTESNSLTCVSGRTECKIYLSSGKKVDFYHNSGPAKHSNSC